MRLFHLSAEPGYSTSFLPFLGIWVGERGDNTVRFVNPKPSLYGKSHLVASHDGRCTVSHAKVI